MNPGNIRIDDYDYPLPDERIARHPLQQRDSCKLLVRDHEGHISELRFDELPGLLPADSMLVCNNTRVINARLHFRKGADGSGALIEIFCLEPAGGTDFTEAFAATESTNWTCIVGNSKRWKEGPLTTQFDHDGRRLTLSATRLTRDDGTSTVRFEWTGGISFSEVIEAVGVIPIPPYLNRPTEESDSADYQTVFSRIEGSVAAPTAGLHFTPELLERLARAGVERRELTLHVGAGTFRPVKSETVADHEMHSEFITASRELIEELASTRRRIVAVGTTSVRTLESLYHLGCLASQGKPTDMLPQWYPYSADHPALSVADAMKALLERMDASGAEKFVSSTRLLIAPGYTYRIVDAIITNFHQPRSTLLLLVSAFTGGDWRPAYDFALDNGFRFLSYGDACLFL